ncbi:hypothetical protein CCP4SC76_2660005 [Gammaproteobacteria bacterium]
MKRSKPVTRTSTQIHNLGKIEMDALHHDAVEWVKSLSMNARFPRRFVWRGHKLTVSLTSFGRVIVTDNAGERILSSGFGAV